MNSNVHPLVVFLVIALTCAAIAIWVWGTGEAANFGGPAELKVDPKGHLYVQIQNQLLEHDSEGRFIARHDLGQLDVDVVFGGVAFFSNGDLLLRRGADPRSLMQNIRAFQRRANDDSLQPDGPDSGLYRCDLATRICRLFGTSAIDFKATHSAFIDWQTDDVYISDTTRHLVRKYSADGHALAGPVAGFKFPNQLVLHDKALLVVDTNLHRVRAIDAASATFGNDIAAHDVVPPVARMADQTWPSHIARIGREWWINNMQADMQHGGVYIFDDNWQFSRRVDLPPDADPIAMVSFGGEVLISDWNNDRIHRVSQAGELLTDFDSPGLNVVLAESRTSRLKFNSYAYAGVALYAMVLLGLILRGITTTESVVPTKGQLAATSTAAATTSEMIWFKPDEKFVRKVNSLIRLVPAIVIVLILAAAGMVYSSDEMQDGKFLVIPFACLIATAIMIARIHRININTAIGIKGEKITLRDHAGREFTARLKDVIYDKTTIATHEMAVFLGQPQLRIYNTQQLEEQLFPRLVDAQQVSALKIQLRLLQIRHPQAVMMLMFVLFIFAILVGDLF